MEEEGRSENPSHEQESLSFSEIASIDGKFLDRIRIKATTSLDTT
jgi:hypothetical protein